jgi:hypothetical protein
MMLTETFLEREALLMSEFVLPLESNGNKNYVLNDAICEYTESELNSKNNLPKGFIWKMPERIAVDMRLLNEAKEQKWATLKDARTAAESAPFICDGSVYQADKERISGAVQLALLAQLAGQPFTIDWTLSDNTVRTLDAAQMIAVGVAMGTSVSAIFGTARSLREQLDAATTIVEVDAIGWPV